MAKVFWHRAINSRTAMTVTSVSENLFKDDENRSNQSEMVPRLANFDAQLRFQIAFKGIAPTRNSMVAHVLYA